ncbi:hypothetical protein FA95DRAFT_411354 [Auriscalpium vulgare]|uniref:Uncharacterized protein n=1 Tax=Auriscalpium vulgare TaxID=40419 RepID=A0ACB8RHA2_9AGAM|nr:hypothetical protein FA95DRAFT_411354 [Auriscalpium vulgare]
MSTPAALPFEIPANYHDTAPNLLLPTTQPRPVRDGARAWMTLFGACVSYSFPAGHTVMTGWLAIAAPFGYTFTSGAYPDAYTRAG